MIRKLQIIVFVLLSNAGLVGFSAGSPASVEYVDKKIRVLESQIASIPAGSTGPVGPQGPVGPAGPAGANGANGTNGQGVPVGGAAGQLLAKIDGVDYNTEWVDPVQYTIGDATEGGIVFFVYKDSAGVQHALISAPADESVPAATYTWANAVTQCNNKNDGTYSDWFLPNKAQIFALFANRYALAPVAGTPGPGNTAANNGGFTTNRYWSSTEVDVNIAWLQNFGSGGQANDITKVTLVSVRCIRAV